MYVVLYTSGEDLPISERKEHYVPCQRVVYEQGRYGRYAKREQGLRLYSLLVNCFEATSELIRLGFDNEIASAHYQAVVTEISRVMNYVHSNEVFISQCIPQAIYSRIFSEHWTTLLSESALQDMILSSKEGFLTEESRGYKLKSLPYNLYLKRRKDWYNFYRGLDKKFKSVSLEDFKFPATIENWIDRIGKIVS